AIMEVEGNLPPQLPRRISYIARLDAEPSIMHVRSDGSFNSVADMKGKNVRFSVMADSAIGTRALAIALGTKPTLVTFNSAPDCSMAVARGDTDAEIGSYGSIMRQVRALGKTKVILTVGDKRDPRSPEILCTKELGIN